MSGNAAGGHPSVEELEPQPQAAEVAAHVAGCETCAREVAWLRAERALLSRRPSPPVQQLWAGIEARLRGGEDRLLRADAAAGRRPRWARRVAFCAAGVAAAAAVVLLALRRPGSAPAAAPSNFAQRDDFRPDPKALAALDRAETDYRDAARVLEAEYQRLRPQLDPALARRWDETLSRAHTQLGEARAVAGDDVNARMQVLDGYAGYLRSLNDVVGQSEEANP